MSFWNKVMWCSHGGSAACFIGLIVSMLKKDNAAGLWFFFGLCAMSVLFHYSAWKRTSG